MTKIFVVFYSTYGHIAKLAETVAKGVAAVPGVEVKIWQVAETLSEEILTKMHAPKKTDYPIITAADLPEADGFLFGFPTRYGTFPAQFKAFLDSTGQLWTKGALIGKPFSFFTSTATIAGGQETTIMTAVTYVTHHGGLFVPLGYSHPLLFDNSEVRGGSPWGAGTIANGDGSRQPSEKELTLAEHQGTHFAKITHDLTKGRAAK